MAESQHTKWKKPDQKGIWYESTSVIFGKTETSRNIKPFSGCQDLLGRGGVDNQET